MLRIRIRDPVPFDPWMRDPGLVKSQDTESGSGMNNPAHIETIFLFTLVNSLMRIRDPEWKKKSDPG